MKIKQVVVAMGLLIGMQAFAVVRADVSFSGAAQAPAERLSLWYRRPASRWTEALPIGNGRLGAMIFGGVDQERLQLNEDTLWAGGPYDPVNPTAKAALPDVRQLIFDGKYSEAARLISQTGDGETVATIALSNRGRLAAQVLGRRCRGRLSARAEPRHGGSTR